MKVYLSTAAVHLSTALKYRRGWSKDNIGVEIIKGFTKNKVGKASQRYRLYLPIHAKRPKIKVPPAVLREVDQAGYVISDYIAGLATQKDGKRVMKIGKLLKDERTRNMFANDEQRQSHKNEYTCVISCHPYDIIGMSTGRTWDQFSCMRLGAGSKLNPNSNNGEDGAYAETLTNDIKQGTLVAYAVKNSDMDIKNPDARLLIKPYMNDRFEVLFRVETKVYGNHVTGFRETISAFLRKVNASAGEGRYSLLKGLYNDGAGYTARHMGPIAFADLNDPAQLDMWIHSANIGDFGEKFKEGDVDQIKKILEAATPQNLLKEYIYNEVVNDLFERDDVELDDARDYLDIVVPKLIDMDKDGREMLNRTMTKFLARFTPHAIPEKARGLLRGLCWYDSSKVYSHGFLVWAYRLNPTLLMEPNGDVNPDFDSYLNARNDYPFLESAALEANQKSRLYQVAILESFVKYAAAKMKGMRHSAGWEPISPSMVPGEAFIKYGIVERVDQMKWTDAQKLYAYAANSFDYFNDDNAHLIGLSYLENLKISDIFNNPYVATIFETGVNNTPNDTAIAGNFASIIERVCRTDKEGVKAEETRLYDLASLLGEHDYNIKRSIEREIERALYD